jgi:hypothetical protein
MAKASKKRDQFTHPTLLQLAAGTAGGAEDLFSED